MKAIQRSPEKVLVPLGFSFSALAAGIKPSGRADLALARVKDARGASAAALFTQNRVVAAPIEVGRSALSRTGGRVGAVLVNSGNANCATGPDGIAACQSVCAAMAKLLGISADEVFPSSTGIIGVWFPVEKVQANLPELVRGLSATARAAEDFARAIMTTDTRPKIASARFPSAARSVRILGIAKGAGMIHPQMATMLVYLFTDAVATPAQLRQALRNACDESLNCISIDGDTSTNDTALLIASGASDVRLESSRARRQFSEALAKVCQSLGEQIVSDGEGVGHVIRLHVEEARTRAEAHTVARAVAHSALVKTAWAGADPNWGRILAAVGRSGVAIDAKRVQIFVGDQRVCRNGAACRFNERRAHLALARPVCDVRVQLGRGRHSVRLLTTDLTAEYVHINADYST